MSTFLRKSFMNEVFILPRFVCRLNFHGRVHSWFSSISITSSDFVFDLDTPAVVSALTTVNSRVNLKKGDLFVISLNDDGSKKLVIQVDEERTNSAPNPGQSSAIKA